MSTLRTVSARIATLRTPAVRTRPRPTAPPAVRRLALWSNPAEPYQLIRQVLDPAAAVVPASAAPPDTCTVAADLDRLGIDPAGIDRAVRLAGSRGGAAQLSVLRYGEPVLDFATGCRSDALFWTFSVSKIYTTVLTHRLIERGLLGLDTPVAAYWPEFGRYGKHRITLRQVLQHRSGFATTGSVLRDLARCTDWEQMTAAIADVRPARQPGTAPAYQFLIFGFILGEVLQRVTGRDLADLISTEILDRIGATDTHLGTGPAEQERLLPVRFCHPGGDLGARAVNRLSTRQAVIPSAGVSATAPQVALLCQALLDDEAGAHRLLAPETLRRARAVTTDGETDRFCRTAIPWSLGFQLGGSRGPGALVPMGRLSSRNTFGHNGSNCCIAWADADRDLVLVYLTDQRSNWNADVGHLSAVADAVLGACRDRVSASPER